MYNILCIITYIILHSVNILDKLNAEARACHKRNKKKKKKKRIKNENMKDSMKRDARGVSRDYNKLESAAPQETYSLFALCL